MPLTKPQRRTIVVAAKSNANYPKEHLMRILRSVEEHGTKREAASLGRVIARLEAWQNS